MDECKTLEEATQRLGLESGETPTVVLDGGIASAKNLAQLRELGLDWITVDSRGMACSLGVPEESHSGRELALLERQGYEAQLQSLHEGLATQRSWKSYVVVPMHESRLGARSDSHRYYRL